jgi:glycosyltransferase involved in cell wall biosynthesis
MNHDFVSIVLPTSNAEDTIEASIISVLEQTYNNFELLIAVNNCTDATFDICNKYKKIDNRIRVFNTEPGIVPALNQSLTIAKYPYIARQDSDDVWYKNKLELQIQFLKENKDIDILGTQINCLDYKTKKQLNNLNQLKRPLNNTEIKLQLLNGWNCIAHPSVVYRKSIMNKLGGYNDTFKFCEDYELWLRAYAWFKFANLDSVLMDYSVKDNPNYNPKIVNYLFKFYSNYYNILNS